MCADMAPFLVASREVSTGFSPRDQMFADVAPFLEVRRDISTRFFPRAEFFDDVAPFLPYVVPRVIAMEFIARSWAFRGDLSYCHGP